MVDPEAVSTETSPDAGKQMVLFCKDHLTNESVVDILATVTVPP
jgi:hypothetical protein